MTDTGTTIPSGFHGVAIFSPYIEIDSGHYRVTASFSPNSTASEVLISVTARTGTELIHQHRQRLLDKSDFREAEFTFQASRQLSEAEFTLHFFGDFVGEFRQIAMERIDPS